MWRARSRCCSLRCRAVGTELRRCDSCGACTQFAWTTRWIKDRLTAIAQGRTSRTKHTTHNRHTMWHVSNVDTFEPKPREHHKLHTRLHPTTLKTNIAVNKQTLTSRVGLARHADYRSTTAPPLRHLAQLVAAPSPSPSPQA